MCLADVLWNFHEFIKLNYLNCRKKLVILKINLECMKQS